MSESYSQNGEEGETVVKYLLRKAVLEKLKSKFEVKMKGFPEYPIKKSASMPYN